MKNVLLFAGTEEGRKIAVFLASCGIEAQVCVATTYGENLLKAALPPNDHRIVITSERMNQEQMEKVLRRERYEMVIDATHPYAQEVTENCKNACERCGVPYYRVVRESLEDSKDDDIQVVESVEAAVAYLQQTRGNILVTTGSKEMETFLALPDQQERVFYRVLSTASVLERCRQLGIEGRQIFAMQGPFSEELNYAMLKEIHAAYLVTKESGKTGGFAEKIQAANRAGVIPIVIGRPKQESGYSYEEMIQLLKKRYQALFEKNSVTNHHESPNHGLRKVTLVGIGTGSVENLTIEAEHAIRQADLLCGAARMLEAVKDVYGESVDTFTGYMADDLFSYIEVHDCYRNIAVLYSGDLGFFSGAHKLLEKIKKTDSYAYHCIPGIASPIYFMARLGIPWEDVSMTSIHGRDTNLMGKVKQHRKVVTLLGGEQTLGKLCESLLENHLGHVKITVGERLSYENERIYTGNPENLRERYCDSLSVVYIENPMAEEYVVTHGIMDEAFVREKVPMTKMEVRSVSLSKLRLNPNAICYDIGAGTGSVSIEMAQQAIDGMVYAIEKEDDACALIEQNRKKFGVTNMKIVQGRAMEVMESLPIPTHAFIGGSAGEMQAVLDTLWMRNPKVRIVINTVTLDTLGEIITYGKSRKEIQVEYVQLTVARSKEMGNYQMMMGQNPVYIITMQAENTK